MLMIFLYFLNHLNLPTRFASFKHQNINFTFVQENVGSLSFLDVKIYRFYDKFVTSVYRNPSLSGVFTNYESFISKYQKKGLLHALVHRNFSMCCDFKTFHFEIDHPHEKQLSPEFC